MAMNNTAVEASVRLWVDTFVVDLNLCPFAKRELVKNRVRFAVTNATTEEDLLMTLEDELSLLNEEPSVETTLLILPDILQDFYDYNQFLDYSDGLLKQMELDGIYQIASFHPNYRFGGTDPQDAENFTNRSPYPILHILREESLDKVLASTEHAEQIPLRNIELMNSMGAEKLKLLLESCTQKPG
jgi:hypothetical protein